MPGTLKLSEYFSGAALVRDGAFAHLDLADAETPGALAFCQQLDYARAAARNANVACVIAKPEFVPDLGAKGMAIAQDPRLAFFRLYRRLFDEGRLRPQMSFGVGRGVKIHPSAVVSGKARIGDGVSIGARAVVEDYASIGDRTVIGPGAVIGADGLLTVREENGVALVVPHAGSVHLGRDVMILAGAVVAKSLYHAPTQIGDASQIGILATVGHGVRIGARCVVSGNCVIAGRARIGDDAWLGASCTVATGLSIGEGARIHVGAVVVRHVAPREAVSGNFALAHAAHMRSFLKAGQP